MSHQRPRAFGFDLGTSTTCVAECVDDNERLVARVIPANDNEQGLQTAPSVICYQSGEAPLVGRRIGDEPPQGSVVKAIKRFIGIMKSSDKALEIQEHAKLNYKDAQWPDDDTPLVLTLHNGEKVNTVEAMSLLTQDMCGRIGDPDALRTGFCAAACPAHFNQARRQAVCDAMRIGGLNDEVVKIVITEPVAAVVAWASTKGWTHDLFVKGVGALVSDLGGGTYDVSYVHCKYDNEAGKEVFTVRVEALAGDNFMGGYDWSAVASRLIAKQLGLVLEDMPLELRDTVQKRGDKCVYHLTNAATFTSDISVDGSKRRVCVTRADFKEAAAALMTKASAILDRVASGRVVDVVIPVGGASVMHMMQELVATKFPTAEKCVMSQVDASTAVARGAAIVAGAIRRDTLEPMKKHIMFMFEDVASHNISIKTFNGDFKVIIPRLGALNKAHVYPTTLTNPILITKPCCITFSLFEGDEDRYDPIGVVTFPVTAEHIAAAGMQIPANSCIFKPALTLTSTGQLDVVIRVLRVADGVGPQPDILGTFEAVGALAPHVRDEMRAKAQARRDASLLESEKERCLKWAQDAEDAGLSVVKAAEVKMVREYVASAKSLVGLKAALVTVDVDEEDEEDDEDEEGEGGEGDEDMAGGDEEKAEGEPSAKRVKFTG